MLFEESPNVATREKEPVHADRLELATKILRIQEAYKLEMYSPEGMFIGSVIDPDTGKILEYRDLIKEVGGDRVDYPWDVSTPTADLVTSKLLINSVISTIGVEFMTADIKKFYL